ncbi:MAG: hypothetical protein SNJ53_01675, partial [Thermodesulfovibrionales bacterium]
MLKILNKDNTPIDKAITVCTSLYFFLIAIATTPAEIMGIVLLFITLLSRRLNPSRILSFFRTDLGIVTLIFVGLHWLGLLWSSDPKTGLAFAKRTP